MRRSIHLIILIAMGCGVVGILGCAGDPTSSEAIEQLQAYAGQNPGMIENAIFDEVNRVRVANQRPALKRHQKPGGKTLDDVAREHSVAMHTQRFLTSSCQENVTYTGKFWNTTLTRTVICPH